MSVAYTHCKIEGCNKSGSLHSNGRRYFIKGLCSMHYDRQRLGTKEINRFTKRNALVEGDIAKIPLGIAAKDGYAIVDADMAWIDKYKWFKTDGYAISSAVPEKTLRKMHRLVMNDKPGEMYDHINRDRLDNRRSNLRKCDYHINAINTTTYSKTGFRGVRKNSGKTWVAQINKNRKHYNSYGHKTIEDAAKAYDEMAIELFGEYAVLNFPKNKTPN